MKVNGSIPKPAPLRAAILSAALMSARPSLTIIQIELFQRLAILGQGGDTLIRDLVMQQNTVM